MEEQTTFQSGENPEEPAAEGSPQLMPSTTSLIFQAPVIPEPRVAEPDDGEDDASEEGRRSRHRTRKRTREAERPARRTTEPMRVKGSTRLEAKKQRRNAGREVGRHRGSVTEVEFQARREAVDRQMIVRSEQGKMQIGVLEDHSLVEHYAARSEDLSLIGNVYLGRVQNVLPSMEAAFVDIGRGRNAVLYSGEVDWEAADLAGKQKRIELALHPGDVLLVQVTKDPVGHKGARLTSQVSLPGRYLVYVPGGQMNGISRKLPDTERARLKKILKEIVPENVGVIVRTAAEGATPEQLRHDVERLQSEWAEITAQQQSAQAPALLRTEPSLLVKVVRDVFNEDITKMVVSGDEAQDVVDRYLGKVAPDLEDRVERYTGDQDVFDAYRINEQLDKALQRKVWLPSGGTLVIDRTEAMTVIDVNTGKFVGTGGNLEETVTKNNLEAAEEIVRQMRLRDLGGIVVVDFIDMVLESNRDLVLRRLVECLSRDRTKHQVAEVTSLGLIQMTRKKIGIGLAETVDRLEAGGHSPDQVPNRPRHRRSGKAAGHKNTLNAQVKNAVAKVAASTIAPAHDGEEADAPVPDPAEPPRSVPAVEEPAPRWNTSRRRGRGTEGSAKTEGSDGLELPHPKGDAARHPRADAAHLLDQVLKTLPDAQPTLSRPARRRRRVTLKAGEPVAEAQARDESDSQG
ncbi:MAG: Rne/Rng family ribonuclease [Microbacteriaceae bacterium]|nr:Rne/Rng family ribonuclease [Microbacteriaceae bacterium]MCI1207137.1 Rne/Rng family ribonuclease [Microbacteriaceae bacterium]